MGSGLDNEQMTKYKTILLSAGIQAAPLYSMVGKVWLMKWQVTEVWWKSRGDAHLYWEKGSRWNLWGAHLANWKGRARDQCRWNEDRRQMAGQENRPWKTLQSKVMTLAFPPKDTDSQGRVLSEGVLWSGFNGQRVTTASWWANRWRREARRPKFWFPHVVIEVLGEECFLNPLLP